MSKFDGVDKAEASDKLPFISPGTYVLEVSRLKLVESKTGEDFFAAEFKVLEAEGAEARPAGTECVHLIKLSGKWRMTALGNVKAFAAALIGESVENIGTSDMDELVSDEQPALGNKIRAFAFNAQTKNGGQFTKVKYSTFAPAVTSPPSSKTTAKSARA